MGSPILLSVLAIALAATLAIVSVLMFGPAPLTPNMQRFFDTMLGILIASTTGVITLLGKGKG